jgi:hypothetical protein
MKACIHDWKLRFDKKGFYLKCESCGSETDRKVVTDFGFINPMATPIMKPLIRDWNIHQ